MAASLIGDLRVDLGANTAEFEAALTRAKAKLTEFGASVSKSNVTQALNSVFDNTRLKLLDDGIARVGLFGSAIEKLGPAGIAGAIGIGAAAVAFEGLRKSLDVADELGKLSQKIGVPIGQLSDLKYAGDLADVSLDQLGTGMKRLSANMADVAEGGKGPAAQAFKALGISVVDTNGKLRSSEDVFSDLADNFSGFKDGATKTALAMAIFGKQGADMVPLLNEGSKGIKDAAAEARAFGLELSGNTSKNAEEFNDNMRRLGLAFEGVGMQATQSVAPAMEAISTTMIEALKNSGFLQVAAEVLSGTFKGLATAGVLVGTAIGTAFQAAEGLSDVLSKILTGDFGGALKAAGMAAKSVVDSQVAGAQLVGKTWTAQGSGPETPEGAKKDAPKLADPNAAKAAADAAKKALAVQIASQQAMDEAVKEELAARVGITEDVTTLAALQTAQVDSETKLKDDKTEGLLQQGKITRGAALVAEALNDRAGDEKDAAITAGAGVKIDQQTNEERANLAGYYAAIGAIQLSLATTASAQNDIEDRILKQRQLDERATVLNSQAAARQVAALDPIRTAQLAHEQDQANAALATKQAAEKEAQARDNAARLANEQNSIANASLDLQGEILASQQGLMLSSYARAKLAVEQLANDQKEERQKLQQIVAPESKASNVDKKIANDKLASLDVMQKNAMDVAKGNASFLSGLEEAASALSSMGQAITSHDFGGLLSGLSSVLKDASGLAGNKKTGISGLLGTLGKALGPIGGIITGVTGILGALFGGDSTVGVAHLSAADQQKLQGSGSVLSSFAAQSASIASSLATATKYQDSDLQYASQQVAYLKDISDNIGNLTAALGSQLGAIGSALDTSKLNLGTTATKGLLGLIGASSTTTSLVDQGINLGSGSLTDFINGTVASNFYQDLQTVKTSSGFLGIGGGTRTTNSEDTSAIGDDITTQIEAVVASLRSGVLQAAGTIGADGAQAALDAFQVNIGRISLDGLDAGQITDQLNAVFSKLGDQLAAAGIPSLTALEKAGEGAMETLERLATEYTTVDTSLASIGLAFSAVGLSSVGARDNLVQLSGGLDTFTSQAAFFQQNFLTDAQAIAPVQKAVAAAMASLGEASVTTKAQFVDLVDSIDVSSASGAALYAALMNVAPAFAKVADFTTSLVSTANDNVAAARSALNSSYQAEIDNLTTLQQTMQGFADSLGDYAKSLNAQADGTAASYQQLSAAFDAMALRAKLGDQTALGGLQDAGSAFLAASASQAATALDQARDIAKVKQAVQAAADTAIRQVNVDQGQLDGINATVNALGLVNTSVLSIADGLSALGAALQAQFAALGDTGSLGASPEVNAVLKSVTGYTGGFGAGGFEAYITSSAASEAQKAAARAVLTSAGQTNRIVGFATGGTAMVGGSGAIDSQLISMRATPGELVSVTHGDPQAATAEALGDQKKLLKSIENLMEQTAMNTAQILTRASRSGVVVRNVPAAVPFEVKLIA